MKTSVKLATKVSCSSTFAIFSFFCELSEIGSKPETAFLLLIEQNITLSDVFGNVGTLSKMEKGLVKVWDLFYG